ncbi:MAG: hypothetical protein IJ390_13215 [Lachnospiraceae bacterium]|nr:hypothetical protein [Lachnospiraceae bacterium]
MYNMLSCDKIQIKAVMENPDLDRNQILQMQRKMLVVKKERMERLIASIDEILKGDNRMDFTLFDETEIHTMYDSMMENMNDEQKKIFIERYGSLDAFKEHFLKNAVSEKVQKSFAKVVEWYGSKEAALEAAIIAFCYVVLTTIKSKLQDAAWI